MKLKLEFFTSILIIFVIFGGCNDNTQPISDKKIHGLNEKEILQSLGTPVGVNYFIISDSVFEERLVLLNILPNYKDEKILIKEMCWYQGKMKRIVWFCNKKGIWVEVGNLIHPKSLQF